MKENIIQKKTFDFAIRIINVYKYLKQNKSETVISKQLLRSGTSIGANIEEAIGGQSKNDFSSKLSVAYKEARESNYWIKILEIIGKIVIILLVSELVPLLVVPILLSVLLLLYFELELPLATLKSLLVLFVLVAV
jgi:four helix bundle protein